MPLSPQIQRFNYMCHSFCWTQVLHNKSGSFDKCRVRPRLSQPTWAVSLPINGHIHHQHLLLLSLKDDTHLTIPREGGRLS